MTKTDNLLKLILLIKSTSNGMLEKNAVMALLGKSRAQSYKIVAEFSVPNDTRPAVLQEVEHKGRTYLELTRHFA